MSGTLHITADDVNCLIYSYFQDSGFQHSAFALRAEARLDHSSHFKKHIPRGELIELLTKALLYSEVEAHWKADAMTVTCKTGFSLIDPHVCSSESMPPPQYVTIPAVPSKSVEETQKTNGATESSSKRKASTPSTDNGRTDKRAKRDTDEMDFDPKIDAPKTRSETKSKAQPATAHPPPAKKPRAKRVPQYDEDTRAPVAVTQLQGHEGEVFNVMWNPKIPSLLATGSRDGTLAVWDMKDPNNTTFVRVPMSNNIGVKPIEADVTALDWSPSGALLAVGTYDGILRVCTSSADIIFSMPQHKGPVFMVKFSADEHFVITVSTDGWACLWDVPQKKLHRKYKCHRGSTSPECCVLDVRWVTDSAFVTSGSDGYIHVMRIDEPRPIKTFAGHKVGADVNVIVCNGKRTRLASCSDDCTIRVWDLSKVHLPDRSLLGPLVSKECIVLSGHTNAICAIVWCPNTPDDAEVIATCSFDKTVRLWNAMTGECIKVFADHKQKVFGLAFSPDGQWLASGGGEGLLHVYAVQAKKKKWTWYAGAKHQDIYEISWQADGNINRIALALANKNVGIVDMTKLKAYLTL